MLYLLIGYLFAFVVFFAFVGVSKLYNKGFFKFFNKINYTSLFCNYLIYCALFSVIAWLIVSLFYILFDLFLLKSFHTFL